MVSATSAHRRVGDGYFHFSCGRRPIANAGFEALLAISDDEVRDDFRLCST
jgi:hypothetical protein